MRGVAPASPMPVPVLIEQTGDTWEVTADGQVWQGFDAGKLDENGEFVIVMPPQGGMTGMISIFPAGEVSVITDCP